jgi:transcriptional regulator with XRE-family HTH domain
VSKVIGDKTDEELASAIGGRLKAYRLSQNIRVEDVAVKTGLSRNTIMNAEAGRNPRLSTLIRLLRAYGRLDNLDSLLPAPAISPLQLLRNRGRVPRRARPRG